MSAWAIARPRWSRACTGPQAPRPTVSTTEAALPAQQRVDRRRTPDEPKGATNSRRPLALNLPVLRFEPNPPALTLSTNGCEVIAREAIPAITDVLVDIHTYAESVTQHSIGCVCCMPKERKPACGAGHQRETRCHGRGRAGQGPPNANSVSGEFHGQFQQPRRFRVWRHRHGARDGSYNFSPQD